MTSSKYNMSFSTGGLFCNESLSVAAIYSETNSWQKTRDAVLTNNILQARTASSAERRAREICFRLERLTPKQLQLLLSGSRQDQQYLLWVAVCKRYTFIQHFASEVLREKFLRMDLLLEPADYDVFFDGKAEWHDELEKLSPSTKAKLRQVLFKIMREAEILSKDNMIIPGLLTQELAHVLVDDNPVWLTVLPLSEADLKGWL